MFTHGSEALMFEKLAQLKPILLGVAVIVVIILTATLIRGTYSVVPAGQYEVKRTWVTGSVDVKMTPGFWLTFGTVQRWPVAETFFFTGDKYEGKSYDQSILVMFNDGTDCKISGTCRVVLPKSKELALALITQRGYQSYEDLEHKLVLPMVRSALTSTANLMSAREAYSERRQDLVQWAWDQIQNGLYVTEEVEKEVKNAAGEMERRIVRVIRRDPKTGIPMRQERHPVAGTGLVLENFEMKKPDFGDKVKQQIDKQQQAYMDVATARANALKAEQDAMTSEAQGKARVMAAKYEEETKKAQAIVQASKEKEVAEIKGRQQLEVAKLDRMSAEQQKQAKISLAEGEARARELQVSAGIDPAQKLQVYEKIMRTWADSYRYRPVPQIVLNGGGAGLSAEKEPEGVSLNQALSLKILQDLALDMKFGAQRKTEPAPVTTPAPPHK
jgi:regulator of protease activity HflC (stomatin/prohibitin superfamily)